MKTKTVSSVGVSGLWRCTAVLLHELAGDKVLSQLYISKLRNEGLVLMKKNI